MSWKPVYGIWLIVLTCAIVVAGIFSFDIPVYNFLRGFDCDAFRWMGVIFSTKNWLVVSAIIVLVFYIRKLIRNGGGISVSKIYGRIKTSYAFWVFCSVLFASVIGCVLKILIGRARPIFYEALGMTGFFPFATDWAFHSMPSGHTLASFAGLVMIGMLAPRGRWFFLPLAVIIGVSRVSVGAHWPTDVMLGALIGCVSAYAVRKIFSSHK